jgi:hypothetical protein
MLFCTGSELSIPRELYRIRFFSFGRAPDQSHVLFNPDNEHL